MFARACRLLRCVAHSSEAILRTLCSISGSTFAAVSRPKFLIGAAPRTMRGRSACVHSYVHACPHERINANVRAHRDATHAKAVLTLLAMMRQTLRRQRSLRIYDLCARACSRSGGTRALHAFYIRACHSCHGLAALWRAVQCSGSVQDGA